MAYFKITQPNQPTKWIKSIDRANGTLEFSEDRNGCFQQDSGFFADSEFAYLKFHFTEAYPELEHMTIDTDWHPNADANPFGGDADAILEAGEPVMQVNEAIGNAQMHMQWEMPQEVWENAAQPQPIEVGEVI